MRKNRMKTVVVVIVSFVGALMAFIVGLWTYMSVSSSPLHPDAHAVPSVAHSNPAEGWAPAVERGRQIMRADLAEQNLPGVSVAVGIDGELVWAEGFGWADLENRVKVTPDTRFKMGMASKVLTSAAVGLLLDRGQLTLDENIRTYVPAFPEKPWPITLRQLMAHMAGIGTDAGDEGPLSEHCDRTLEGLRLFADDPLRFEPGTKYRYSNYGWILVSAAVEHAAGEPFFRFMRRHVFEPLGMQGTRDETPAESIPDRATPYFPRFAADPRFGPQPPREPDVDYTCFAGSGAFVSTPSDLVRFGMAMQSGKFVRPGTVQLLQTSQKLPGGDDTGYGLGWDLEPVTLLGRQAQSVGHDGTWMGGRVMSFVTFPDRRLVVAVMSNTAWADTFAIATRIAEAFAQAREQR